MKGFLFLNFFQRIFYIEFQKFLHQKLKNRMMKK